MILAVPSRHATIGNSLPEDAATTFPGMLSIHLKAYTSTSCLGALWLSPAHKRDMHQAPCLTFIEITFSEVSACTLKPTTMLTKNPRPYPPQNKTVSCELFHVAEMHNLK